MITKYKKKVSAWLSLLLCMTMLLQPLQTLAADNVDAASATYTVTVDHADQGTVQADSSKLISSQNEKSIYEYAENEKVTITVQPADGWDLEKVSIQKEDGTEIASDKNGFAYSFQMPAGNVSVSVGYKEVLKESVLADTEEKNEEQPSETDADQKTEDIQKNPESDNQENIPEDKNEIPEQVEEDVAEKDVLTPEAFSFAPQLFPLARASVTIVNLGKVTYGQSTCGHFELNGKIAFCLEHEKTTPSTGTSFAESIYENADIRKALYYGWGGPGQWSGFSSEAHGIVATSLVLSHYYSGTNIKPACQSFYNFLQTQPAVASSEMTLSKSYTESYLSSDKTYQRTDSIKYTSAQQNTITIQLPNGVTLVNETTGTSGTGKVTVKGGDTFYLKAPLTMNGTWNSGNMYGSMGKFQAVLYKPASSGLQDIGQGRWATDPDNYVNLSVKWVQMGDIRLQKFLGSDNEVKQPAVGAEFTLTHQETGEQVVITADENGIATTEDKENYPVGRLIGGEWLIEETKTPEGFKPIDPFKVTVSGQGQVFSYIVEDKEIYAALQVVKVDKSTGNVIAASGATFKIVDADGKDVEFTSYSPSKVTFTEFTTDENGQFTLPNKLKYGTYRLVEVKAPEGYLLCDPIEFTVDQYQDWETPIVLKAEDENAKGIIRLKKTDEETNEAVAGAEYQIIAAEDIVTGDGTVRAAAGETVGTMTTDQNGAAASSELFLGKYIVKEASAPDGYVLDQAEHEVTLAYQDQDTEIVYQDVEVTDKPTTVTITKKAAGKEQTLKGVKFKVWNEDMVSSDVDPELAVKEICTTDESGQISLKYLQAGSYCIQETETLPGYILDETVRKFTIDEQGMVLIEDQDAAVEGSICIENDYTKLQISKQDATNGKELPGAELEIRDKDGNLVDKWTSTDKMHVIDAIAPGEYVLKETIAPDGYLVANEIRFTVKETGEVQQVVMKDELKEGTIRTSIPSNFRDGSGTHGTAVKTGDTAAILSILAVMAIAAGAVAVVLYRRKRKESGYEKA